MDSYDVFKYNVTCDRIEYKTYYSDNSIWLWYEFKYEEGRLIENFSPLDSNLTKYSYDNQNNCVKSVKFNKLGEEKEVITYIYKYDDKSNWIKKTCYRNGKIYWVDERHYDYYE